MAQFLQQFHTRIALDRVVVEVMSNAAFKFLELGQGQGVLTSKDEFIQFCIVAQTL